MLFAAPQNADAVLMINPRTNVTDITTLSGLEAVGHKWRGIAYAPSVDMLFAAPQNADAVLMINPRTNVTDTTTLAGLGTGGDMWTGIAFAPSAGTLFAAPFDADAVLGVRFVVELSVVAPLRQVTELTAQLSSLQNERVASEAVQVSAQQSTNAALLSSQVARLALQASLSSSDAAQSAMRAELSTVSNTVCNRPVCAAGTRPENGACVPDCTNLERRSISCEPYCDGTVTAGKSGSSPSSPAGLIAGIVLGGVVAVAIAVVVYRRRAMHRELPAEQPAQTQAMAMYVNPLHTGTLGTAEPNEAFVESSAVVGGSAAAVLDEELYVAQPASTDAAGVYSACLSDRVENAPLYHVFKGLHATADGDRDETA
jgi:hypothetical protein